VVVLVKEQLGLRRLEQLAEDAAVGTRVGAEVDEDLLAVIRRRTATHTDFRSLPRTAMSFTAAPGLYSRTRR
jgi:hypothetical protein